MRYLYHCRESSLGATGRLLSSILVCACRLRRFSPDRSPFDSGISHAYGGVLSALSIHFTLTPLDGHGHGAEQRWIEKEVVSALYPDGEEVIVVEERQVVGDFRGY